MVKPVFPLTRSHAIYFAADGVPMLVMWNLCAGNSAEA